MIYFDSDMSKSTNAVVYFDWKTVIYIYACGKCRTQFMLPMEKSVTFTGACANEIIPSINRSFVYKAKEGGHVRMLFSLPDPECHVRYCHHLVSVVVLKLLYFTLLLLNDWARSEIHERNKGPKVSKRYCLFLIFFSEYMSTHGLLF